MCIKTILICLSMIDFSLFLRHCHSKLNSVKKNQQMKIECQVKKGKGTG